MSDAAGAATAAGDALSDGLVAMLGEAAIEKLLAPKLTPEQVLKEYDATGQRYNNAQRKKAAERWKSVVAPQFKAAHGTDTKAASWRARAPAR